MTGFPYGLEPDGTVTVTRAGRDFVGHYRRLRGRPIIPRQGPVRVSPERVLVHHPDMGSREGLICRCNQPRHSCSAEKAAAELFVLLVEDRLRQAGELPPPLSWGRCW